jgi:preprotein translocase subunit SecE
MSRTHTSPDKSFEAHAPSSRPRTSFLKAARNYYWEVLLEMRRVTWPSWEQVRSTTAVVIFFVFAMALYLAAVDGICAKILGPALRPP